MRPGWTPGPDQSAKIVDDVGRGFPGGAVGRVVLLTHADALGIQHRLADQSVVGRLQEGPGIGGDDDLGGRPGDPGRLQVDVRPARRRRGQACPPTTSARSAGCR